MLPKSFIWCHLPVLLLLLIGFSHNVGEDDYKIRNSEMSVKQSDTILGFIRKITNGTDLTKRTFRCSAKSKLEPTIQWEFKACREKKCPYKERDGFNYTSTAISHYRDISIDITESGYLKCIINNTIDLMELVHEIVPINNTGQVYIELTEQSSAYNVAPNSGDIEAVWHIRMKGTPPPELTLFVNNKTIESLAPRYECKIIDNKQISLKIKNATAHDTNVRFTLFAKNKFENVTFTLIYYVGEPVIDIRVVKSNSTLTKVKCRGVSPVDSDISFEFFEICTKRKTKCKNSTIPLKKAGKLEETDVSVSSYLELDASILGYLKCSGNNTFGTRSQQYNLTRQPNVNLTVTYLDSTIAKVRCEAVSLLDSDIRFEFFETTCPKQKKKCKDIPVKVASEFETTPLTVSASLELDSSKSGYLKCSANNSMGTMTATQSVASMSGSLNITGPENIETVDEITKRIEVDDDAIGNITLMCSASAHNHTSKVEWAHPTQNDIISDVTYENKVFSKIAKLKEFDDYGTYYCITKNNISTEIKKIEVIKPGGTVNTSSWQYYFIILGLIALVVLIAAFVLMKMRRIQNEMDELKVIGLVNFEKGALELLNPNLTLDDQADLLPYDNKYEIPIENLTLGEQIGAGAFGVVVKGEAKGIFECDKSIPVAVKMVNKYTGDMYIKALASELKIMIHLGKHVNVVNLLGACTKNIVKRELLVVVEYCRFGNLKDYVLNHRHTFIDQINKETGDIDFNIGSDILGTNRSKIEYTTLAFSNSGYEDSKSSIPSVLTEQEEEKSIPKVPDPLQSEESPNYKGEYDDKNKVMCTKDLLIWSFQVATGMEYLSSRKVLHGDLAARNILLTDGNIVKICDFGLSKNMYHQDIYKKKGEEMLPVKWMAIEAITDRIFSVQSDVWSFGVVMWEFFSLARAPYLGMEFNELFCQKLLDGFRMNSPQYATEEIYEIMLKCWDADPLHRPSFADLSKQIGALLEEPIREHYIDMNSGYVKMNSQRLEEQNEDYLSMVGAPDFRKFSSPYGYVNVVKLFQGKPKESENGTDTRV